MKKILLFFIFLFLWVVVNAQNPFAHYGYKVKIATMSNGKFEEFHDANSIVEIGSIRFDTRTNKIVNVIKEDSIAIKASPHIVSRFVSIDPHAEKYYSISPYAYCANNPINAIDPSGKLVVFINGMHAVSGGKSEYWGGVDYAIMNRLKDYNRIYRDGSVGGLRQFPLNLDATFRYKNGYQRGLADIKDLIRLISDDNGNLKETIKIITHSMGGVYGKGYVEAIRKYFIENNISLDFIDFEADFAPFQPTKQKAVSGVETFQFTNAYDNIANDDILGSPFGFIQNASKVYLNMNENAKHGITNFFNDVSKLPAGKYKVVNGEIIRE